MSQGWGFGESGVELWLVRGRALLSQGWGFAESGAGL